MKTFKLTEEGVSYQIEYCVLKCPACGSVFRHDISLNSFGKPIRNRDCLVCGGKVPVDDLHCLDHDPMAGSFKAEFKSGTDVKTGGS